MNQNGQRAQDTSRGFPCVLRLIEHYSAKYADMNVVALRYPVLRDDMKIQDGIGEFILVELPWALDSPTGELNRILTKSLKNF